MSCKSFGILKLLLKFLAKYYNRFIKYKQEVRVIYSTFNLLNIYNAIASLFLIHIPFDIFGEEDEVVVEVNLCHFDHVLGYAEIGFCNAACDRGDRIRIAAD